MLITKKDIKELSQVNDHPCISIFIPTHRSGFNNARIDQLSFKNALNDARTQMEQWRLEPNEMHGTLQAGYELLENEAFWTKLSDGLAVFISPTRFEYFELPITFNTYVFVGRNFHLRPLLPMFTGDGRFFLLALSQNEVRFFEGQRNSITPVIIEDLVPEDIEEALFFSAAESHLQAHSGGEVTNPGIYHGHGKGKDEKNKQLEKYFRQVDKGLMEMLHDENVPLVIAAVDYLVPIYQAISQYANIMSFSVKGNPENDSPVQLHQKAWSLMQPYFKEKQISLANEFQSKFALEKADISAYSVIPTAINGRVDTLFIDKDEPNLWGQFNAKENKVRLHLERKQDSICLLNKAAVETFLQGGNVYNLSREELPYPAASLNAIYRY